MEGHDSRFGDIISAFYEKSWIIVLRLGTIQSIGFPFNLPSHDALRPNLPWDSPACPSEMSASYTTNKCYT